MRTSLFSLTDRYALVTGGASAIGLAIAEAFQEHGAQVVASRNEAKVFSAVSQHNGNGAKEDRHDVVGLKVDVTSDAMVEHAIAPFVSRFGGIDVVVNAAGYTSLKPSLERNPSEYNQFFDTHVTGSFRCAKASAIWRKKNGQGSLSNVASIASCVALLDAAP